MGQKPLPYSGVVSADRGAGRSQSAGLNARRHAKLVIRTVGEYPRFRTRNAAYNGATANKRRELVLALTNTR